MGRGTGSGTKHTWKTALTDTPTTDEEGVGQVREEFGPLGYRRFIWARVVQSTGGSVGDVMQYGLRWGGELSVSVIDGLNSQLTVITAGGNVSFITATTGCDAEDNAFVDDWIVVTSTVTAGGAPEGEMRKIRSNTSNRFFVATDFSVAPSVLDNFNIIRPGGVVSVTSAGVAGAGRIAGVLMADIAAFEYGWLQTTGIHTGATVDTLESSAEGPAIIGPGGTELSSTLIADSQSTKVLPAKVVGFFLASVQLGLASLKSPVYLDI